ncbi:hypothetical protein ACFWMS_25015 [Peribacillus butanolivorans]|uniref:hypothetical protein n=1 Tax=Peribacillus butanolivorans TaxID=421767 RepID=UPI00365AA2AF
MITSELINTINSSHSNDFNVDETEIWLMGKNVKGITFFLRNDNKDNVIKNPYEVAIDLIYSHSVFDVTIIDWEKYRSFSYYKDVEGRLLVGLEDFDKFARNDSGKLGKSIIDIFFTVLPLDENQLSDLSKMKSIQDVLEYIIAIPYNNSLIIKSQGWEEEEYFEEETVQEVNKVMEELDKSQTLHRSFSPQDDDLPY